MTLNRLWCTIILLFILCFALFGLRAKRTAVQLSLKAPSSLFSSQMNVCFTGNLSCSVLNVTAIFNLLWTRTVYKCSLTCTLAAWCFTFTFWKYPPNYRLSVNAETQSDSRCVGGLMTDSASSSASLTVMFRLWCDYQSTPASPVTMAQSTQTLWALVVPLFTI